MKRMIVACFVILCLSACASPYQRTNFFGGYDETVLAKNIFRVKFEGNGYTSPDRAKDFAMLRGAEVCLEHGYKFFVIAGDDSYTNTSSVYVPGNTTTSYTGQTTGQVYGNGQFAASSHGVATTHFTPGFFANFLKPSAVFVVIAFNDEDAPKNAFDAAFLCDSIKTKYKIK